MGERNQADSRRVKENASRYMAAKTARVTTFQRLMPKGQQSSG
jgi:hypothetical protein